jgi:hypothetical protein
VTPNLVYHYTTPSGLLGIVSTSCVWLTDLEFMNDTEEIQYARSGVVAELRRRVAGFDDPPEDGYKTAEGSRAFVAKTIADELERRSGKTWHVYGACFCEDGDLLSQWRGYSGSAGYAIGFKAAYLTGISRNSEGNFARVEYGTSAAKDSIDAMLEEITPGPGGTGHPNAKANILLMKRALPQLSLIKHPSFSEEREWRLTFTSWGLHGRVKFRAGNFGITPYVETEINLEQAIAEIIVGPGNHPDARVAGLSQLLESSGLSGVAVRKSQVPFRS